MDQQPQSLVDKITAAIMPILNTVAVADYEVFWRIANVNALAIADHRQDPTDWGSGYQSAIESVLMDTIRKPLDKCLSSIAHRRTVPQVANGLTVETDSWLLGYQSGLNLCEGYLTGKRMI